MTLREVDYVDIITDAGPVRCVVVIAEYVDALTLAGGYLCDVREKVVRDALGILADKTARMCTDRVEIAEQHDLPLVVAPPDIREDPLLHGFCCTVWICGLAERALLGDRDKSRIAVDCCRGRENDLLYAVLPHDITQDQCGFDVVVIIFDRLLCGFADCLVTGKVDGRIDVFFIEKRVQRFAVADIQLVKCRALTRNCLDPIDDQRFRVVEVIRDDDVVAGVKKLHACMTSDKTCSACD